jgi:hypothetical protein
MSRIRFDLLHLHAAPLEGEPCKPSPPDLSGVKAWTRIPSYSVVNVFIGLVTPSVLPVESIESTL